jgi:hypothetical protein
MLNAPAPFRTYAARRRFRLRLDDDMPMARHAPLQSPLPRCASAPAPVARDGPPRGGPGKNLRNSGFSISQAMVFTVNAFECGANPSLRRPAGETRPFRTAMIF